MGEIADEHTEDRENGGTRGRGRPRSERTRRAVLDAAADLLDEGDLRALSIERVAARAKVGKQSIYRWWPTRADLLLDAFAHRASASLPRPVRTGDPLVALETFLREFFRVMRDPVLSGGVRTLIAEVQCEAELRTKFYERFLRSRRKVVRELIRDGIIAGRIRADADVNAIVDMVFGAFWFRLLSGTPFPYDDAFAKVIAETVMLGVALPTGERPVLTRETVPLIEP